MPLIDLIDYSSKLSNPVITSGNLLPCNFARNQAGHSERLQDDEQDLGQPPHRVQDDRRRQGHRHGARRGEHQDSVGPISKF